MTDRPINLRPWQVRAAVEGRLSVLVVPMRVMPGTTLDHITDWTPNPDGLGSIGHVPLDRLMSPLIVGDRYWARETWTHAGVGVWDVPQARRSGRGGVRYQADGKLQGAGWWSSAVMPREFSRITIVPTEVRVARLHDLTRDEAIGTGVITDEWREWREDAATVGLPAGSSIEDEIGVFARHWDTKDGPTAWNGPGAYERNPWVCIARCAVHLRNIDKESEHG